MKSMGRGEMHTKSDWEQTTRKLLAYTGMDITGTGLDSCLFHNFASIMSRQIEPSLLWVTCNPNCCQHAFGLKYRELWTLIQRAHKVADCVEVQKVRQDVYCMRRRSNTHTHTRTTVTPITSAWALKFIVSAKKQTSGYHSTQKPHQTLDGDHMLYGPIEAV